MLQLELQAGDGTITQIDNYYNLLDVNPHAVADRCMEAEQACAEALVHLRRLSKIEKALNGDTSPETVRVGRLVAQSAANLPD